MQIVPIGKIRKYFNMLSAENFTQSAMAYLKNLLKEMKNINSSIHHTVSNDSASRQGPDPTAKAGLEFNSPVNTVKVMSSWSVYLTTPFLGRFSPLYS